MKSKDLNQFYNEVMSDMANNPSWLKDLESSSDFESLFTKLSKLGTEKGYSFSDQELRGALDSVTNLEKQELSDELLVGVAGGKDGEPRSEDTDGDGTLDKTTFFEVELD
jgi:hypothetical protein